MTLIKYPMTKDIVCVRGGGDLATGVIAKLYHAGYRVLICEIEKPTAIRTTLALSSCIFKGEFQVEDVFAKHCSNNIEEINSFWKEGFVPVIIDPNATIIKTIKPDIVIDAILAKKNLGTTIDMAKIVIGMGPGFRAGEDCHVVIETKRGHKLGTLIYSGSATANTGIPGVIAGKSSERVLRAPKDGNMRSLCKIGDTILENEPILEVDNEQLLAPFTGIIRGLLPDNFKVFKGMKIGDIDPRELDKDNIYNISDKAKALGGAVMDAIATLSYRESIKKS
ncbi:MAG: selenium-dependent molybdenum cofactor biosynthesis protein YqeB [Anaerorhabdus sp.]